MVGADTQRYIDTIRRTKTCKNRLAAVLPVVSLLVIAIVFWWLKLTGITLAGEAFCGMEEHAHEASCAHNDPVCTQEHQHTDACYEPTYSCGKEEHTHVSSCYSDIHADVETAEDWEATLADIPAGISAAEKIMAVAQSQLGYTESELNFAVDADGTRHGYTRYGAWYGNPYGAWSAMFTAFCLRYAGLADVPVNAGAETMRLQWDENGLYQAADLYTPLAGDIVFLDKDANGAADATAVILDVAAGAITVIEGDLEGRVAEKVYAPGDTAIHGYGLLAPGSSLLLVDTAADDGVVIAQTTAYDQSLFTETSNFVVYTASGSDYYAFDGNGNAVQIYIDADGNITADVNDPDLLLWSFTSSGSTDSYVIQNVGTGRYMHAYPNSGTGVTTSGAYPSVLVSADNGVRIQSNTEYAALNVSDGVFEMTQRQSDAAIYSFGMVSRCTVWLDGTNGGLMSLGGTLDKSYAVESGATIRLPEEWQSPSKYSYTLRGWYDVKNSKYYTPGAQVTVTENMVFYADWAASTYDIGEYNSHVADTISTNNFITTRVFDFNTLFNVLSERATVSANSSGHTESWDLIASGIVPFGNQDTLDFIFSDYDSTGDISYPNSLNSNNTSGGIVDGLYASELGEILFSDKNAYDPSTGTGIIGKQYLGTADHLFQFMSDPTDAHHGYYYYDSRLNAASYNQTDERFYVYDYLERTADSAKDGGVGEYSDFLPFNSPYANTNGNTVVTYTYDGENGEYAGVEHSQYDAKYDTLNNASGNVGTNYGFGMSLDIRFYLPFAPGSADADGEYENRDVYGKEMCFEFSGDDDVWVLIDGELVLDLGGIHGVESGGINFSSGAITINGEQIARLSGVSGGEHTLTVQYLERGSSQSNCAIYFNLAPRFSLSIEKEDVLTRELLNGAEFSVYTDEACTVPATLWESAEAYDNGEPSTHSFTVRDGVARIWGLVSGKTYYIKETKPPDVQGYSSARGIICFTLDKQGVSYDSVEMIPDPGDEGNSATVSKGYTVHGFKIDEETQQTYIAVTNAPDWVTETTTVQVYKEWKDTQDHTGDAVQVYLTVTDGDGTARRIREITLSEENQWRYTWTNLPKYAEDGITEIRYTVEEAYQPGYASDVERVTQIITTSTAWTESSVFENGGSYILHTDNGYLSAASVSDTTLTWVNEETAKTSPLALWNATVNGNSIRLTNQTGQTLSFNYANSSNRRYFYATGGTASSQNFVSVQSNGGIRLYCSYNNRSYYVGGLKSDGNATATTSSGSALTFSAMRRITNTSVQEAEGLAFRVTNTPLEVATSLRVTKVWDTGTGADALYEKEQVTVKLLANGKDTGLTVTLSLKNSWTDSFPGLPYTDEDGNVISYTVEEDWENEDWDAVYSETISVDGDPPTYQITVTNVYSRGQGYELPSTGGLGQTPWILGGFTLVLGSLAAGAILRCNRQRRKKS